MDIIVMYIDEYVNDTYVDVTCSCLQMYVYRLIYK